MTGSKSTKSSYKINRSWGYKISVQVSRSVVSDSLPPPHLPAPPPPPLSPSLPSASFPHPIFAPHCPSLATNRCRPLHFRSVSHTLIFTHKNLLPLVSPLPPVAPPGVPPRELCRQEGIEGNTIAQRLQVDWKLKEGMQFNPWAWGRHQQVTPADTCPQAAILVWHFQAKRKKDWKKKKKIERK